MAQPEYDLTPSDGLSNHWVFFDGLDVIRGKHGSGRVRFRVFKKDGDQETDLGELSFDVGPGPGGTQELIARGHDKLVDALRQMLYVADKMRRAYRNPDDDPRPT